MDPLVTYAADFEEIVELIWQIHSNSLNTVLYSNSTSSWNTLQPSSTYLLTLQKEILRIKHSYFSTFTIEKEDIRQELRYLWIKYSKVYKEKGKQKKTSLRDYLLACSVWGLKGWYYREVVGMSQDRSPSLWSPIQIYDSTPPDFTLDLQFVAYGTNMAPLDALNAYERYLIFLMYKMEKNIVEIAYIMQKHRQVVSLQLQSIHTKLRRLANGE